MSPKPPFEDPPATQLPQETMSRRDVIRHGAAAMAGATALLGAGSTTAAAQAPAPPPPGVQPAIKPAAAAVVQRFNTGDRRFRGFARYGTTAGVINMQLRPDVPGPRQVLIRSQATQACYTIAGNFANATVNQQAQMNAQVPGHGGCGIVVAVGPDVRRFVVGDRVVVGVTPQCGQCYNCLQGRSDLCSFLNNDPANGGGSQLVFATIDMPGNALHGGPVNGGRSGFAEYMLINEEWGVPVFTDLPSAELSLLSCVGTSGLAPPLTFEPVEAGSDVVVFGLGPIGLSMVNGAAIAGAGQIIAIDPIAERRQAALDVGATMVIDPTGKDTTLVNEIRELCKGRTNRYFAGGRPWAGSAGLNSVDGRGPDRIYEAVGGTRSTPTSGAPPDPNGILPLQQAYDLCPSYGVLVTVGVGQVGNVTFPAAAWAGLNCKTHRCAQYGGADLMRDVPRFVTLMERGLYKASRIVTARFPIDRTLDAMRASADRSTISAHVVFDGA